MACNGQVEGNPPVPKKPIRQLIIEEIISTEDLYISKLKAIVDVFIHPLTEKRILSEEDILCQFGGLETILSKHLMFYDELTALFKSDSLLLGELFLSFGEELKCYETYMVNFEVGLSRRAALLMSNRKFATFIDNSRAQPLCGGGLESLLIGPVQRIPRYRLLLDQMLKNTDQEHEDFIALKEAFEKVQYQNRSSADSVVHTDIPAVTYVLQIHVQQCHVTCANGCAVHTYTSIYRLSYIYMLVYIWMFVYVYLYLFILYLCLFV